MTTILDTIVEKKREEIAARRSECPASELEARLADAPPARGPWPELTDGKEQVRAGVASFTIPFNLSWHPAATVRAGLSDAGLPVGLQIVAPRHRDDLALQASWAFEQARPWAREWPDSFL